MEAITQEQIKDHLERKDWNEKMIKRLGLRCEKENLQTIHIRVYMGELSVYHDWTAHRSQQVNYEMHIRLETFLKGFVDHLFQHPDVDR